jgi:hypothetical protein
MNGRFSGLTQYAGTKPYTTSVMHGVYLEYVDDADVIDNHFNIVSGCGVFLKLCTRVNVHRNDLYKVEWYPIHCDYGNSVIDIGHNRIHGNVAADCVYFGGGIDVMGLNASESGGANDTDIFIHHNYLTGVYKYFAVIRVLSGNRVIISDNILRDCTLTYKSPDSPYTETTYPSDLIHISTRDTNSGNNGPPKDITIANNIMYATGTTQRPIMIRTTASDRTNTTAGRGIIVKGNQARSVDASNYFFCFCQMHGFASGFTDIVVADNIADGIPLYDANYSYSPGMVSFVTDANDTISGIVITGNSFEYYNGTGSTNQHNAVRLEADVEIATVRNNRFKNFYYGIYIHSNNTSQAMMLDDVMHNHYESMQQADMYFHGTEITTR